MKFHDTLSEKIFNGEELKPEVKEKLNEIADAFIEFLEVPTDAIKDVVLTGSMMSYNYTKYSDIDLHLLVDFEKVHEDCPLVGNYLISKKSEFNKNHDIFIYGIPVEVYAESIDNDNVHNGLYSLKQDKWIDFPKKIKPTDNDAAVEAKFNEFKDLAEICDDSEVAVEIIDKIKKMRKAGLAEGGEFSTENLTFKKLRDEGIIGKLMEIKKQGIDKQLSLESYNESKSEMKLIFELTDKKDKSFEEEIDIYKDEDGDFICNVPKHTKLGKDQTLVGNTIQILKDVIKKEFEKEGYKVKYKNIEYPIKHESIKESKSYNKDVVTKTQNGVTWTGFDTENNDKIWVESQGIYTYVKYQPNEKQIDSVCIQEVNKDNYKERQPYHTNIPIKALKHPMYTFWLGKDYWMDNLQDAIDFIYKHFEHERNKNESIKESENIIAKINKLIDNVNKTILDTIKNKKEAKLYTLKQNKNKDGQTVLKLYRDDREFMTSKLAGDTLLGDDIIGHLNAIKSSKYESIKEDISVSDYLKSLKDNGTLTDMEGAEYLVQSFNDGKLEVIAGYKDIEKAAKRFLDICGKYDKAVFKQLFDNGKDIKILDSDHKELNEMPKYLSFVNESTKDIIKDIFKEHPYWSKQTAKQISDELDKLPKGTKFEYRLDNSWHECIEYYVKTDINKIFDDTKANWSYIYTVDGEEIRRKPLTSFEVALKLKENGNAVIDKLVITDDIAEDYASLYDKVDSANSDLKELVNDLPQFFEEDYKDGIYKISTIGKALQMEKEFLDSVETVDGQADSIMSFIIPDGETIEKTILTKRDKIKDYKPQENEYFLDMVRDTGWWTTDYNLAPMQKLVNRWNGITENYELERIIKLALGE